MEFVYTKTKFRRKKASNNFPSSISSKTYKLWFIFIVHSTMNTITIKIFLAWYKYTPTLHIESHEPDSNKSPN